MPFSPRSSYPFLSSVEIRFLTCSSVTSMADHKLYSFDHQYLLKVAGILLSQYQDDMTWPALPCPALSLCQCHFFAVVWAEPWIWMLVWILVPRPYDLPVFFFWGPLHIHIQPNLILPCSRYPCLLLLPCSYILQDSTLLQGHTSFLLTL